MIDKRKDLPCAVVKDLLPLYHDGVVSGDTSGLIEAHLEDCESCRNELNSIRNDEKLEENLIEQDKDFYFKEFRDGVRTLRRIRIFISKNSAMALERSEEMERYEAS